MFGGVGGGKEDMIVKFKSIQFRSIYRRQMRYRIGGIKFYVENHQKILREL